MVFIVIRLLIAHRFDRGGRMGKATRIRRIFQIVVFVAMGMLILRNVLGKTYSTPETYCPMGGLVSLYAFITGKTPPCSMSETNLVLFIAVLLLALLAKRSFCGWICPVGALGEWFGILGRKLEFNKNLPKKLEKSLRAIKYIILVLVLIFTVRVGELIYRGYDPYYALISLHGEDIGIISYISLGLVIVAAIIISMAFCRYLCPFGAFLNFPSRVGLIKLHRDEKICTQCNKCDKACPLSIEVSSVERVTDGNCTNCLACVDACPEEGALRLEINRRWR